MQKVYMITFHGSVNYGAAMQAYALCRKIQELGYDVKIIDYNRKKHHESFIRLHLGRNPLKAIRQIREWRGRKVMHEKFDRFVLENFPLTEESYNGAASLASFQGERDAVYLVGSDQVWNCSLTENDFHYFLDFTDAPRKYSYGSSFGVSDVRGWDAIEMVKKLLGDFKKISVREEAGAAIVEELIQKRPAVVCDPTFLITGEEWGRIAQRPNKAGYVLLFMLAYDPELVGFARSAAAAKGLALVNIVYMAGKVPGAINVGQLGPEEWLGYLANADFVFTNSLHGFALSLNMQKQVWVRPASDNRQSRILNLASRYHVADRVISGDAPSEAPIDYEKVRPYMEKDRAASIAFLEECLHEGSRQDQ